MGKVSKVKRSNIKRTKLARQGKLKHKRHKKTIVNSTKEPPKPEYEDEEVVSDHGEDISEMVEDDDLEFLKSAVAGGQYSFFSTKNLVKKKRKLEDDDIESKYEDLKSEINEGNKRPRHLLPIKTDGGIIRRAVMEEVKDKVLEKKGKKKGMKEEVGDGEKEEKEEEEMKFEKPERDLTRAVSVSEMLAWREEAVARYKFRIGILCSGLLEDPQNRVMNISRLLEIYDDWQPELQVTLKKLVMISLLEVFKDILPAYQIKHQDNETVKLKKDTRELQNYEKRLLKGYRGYLTRLEKLAGRLYKKKGDQRVFSQHDVSLGELALKCLCELLKAHSYFNYSKNLVQLLTPFLNNKLPSVRAEVSSTFTFIFSKDKKGEVTLDIVRRINDLVKKKKHAVNCEVISVLSSLRLDNINLDDIKEKEALHKKALAKKSRIINLSKKERKRMKRMEEVEKELMETKAEENKMTKQSVLTEVTKMVFTIYFRILKNAPSSGLLSAALQGVSKFAGCINIDFYEDLVLVLNRLMEDEELKVKEQLNCENTVFSILSGHGEAFNIDPNKFYTHFYNTIMKINAGRTSENCELMLTCLEKVVIGRRKKLSLQRTLAFIKRIASISLYQEHNTILALLLIIKQVVQSNKALDVLLDTDSGVGQGLYLPYLHDPEHCNPASTALYELSSLSKHYHPIVRKMAQMIASEATTQQQSLPLEISKLSIGQIFKEFNPREVAFKPAVPPPKKKISSKVKFTEIKDKELASLCNKVLNMEFTADFSSITQDCKVKTEPRSCQKIVNTDEK